MIVCTCCRTTGPLLHAHGKRCEVHGLTLVVPSPPPLGEPDGEDCTGPTVTRAIAEAYRASGRCPSCGIRRLDTEERLAGACSLCTQRQVDPEK